MYVTILFLRRLVIVHGNRLTVAGARILLAIDLPKQTLIQNAKGHLRRNFGEDQSKSVVLIVSMDRRTHAIEKIARLRFSVPVNFKNHDKNFVA